MNSPRRILEGLRRISELDARLAALPAGSSERTSLSKERGVLLDGLPGNYRYLYEKLQSQKGSVLAILSGKTCSGCNMILPPQLISEIRKLQALQLCPTCKRILDPGAE